MTTMNMQIIITVTIEGRVYAQFDYGAGKSRNYRFTNMRHFMADFGDILPMTICPIRIRYE